MLKFTLKEGRVIVDPNILLIEEFNNILSHGKKAKQEDVALRMLLYVFYCCDLSADNPMRDLDYRQKPEQAFNTAFRALKKDKFSAQEEDLVNAAISAYNMFNENAAERAVLAIDEKIDQIRTVLENTEPIIERNINAATGAVAFVSNEKILGNMVKQVDEFMKMKISIQDSAKKLENTGRVRANKKSSALERGNLLKNSASI